MTDPRRPMDGKQWDCIVDLIAAEQASLSQAEVQQELRKRGIDVSGTVARIRSAIEQKHARIALVRARIKRPTMLARIQDKLNASLDAGRDELVQLVKQRLHGPKQAAMFSRLDEAATADDLKSLLADLAALDELREEDPADDAG